MEEIKRKYETLLAELASYKKLAVAFSGGVDSTFLLRAAKEALGENVIAITARAPVVPADELRAGEELCRQIGVRQVSMDFDPFTVPGFSDNPKDRCYICKKAIFSNFVRTAADEGFEIIAEGSNLDDDGDYRPGHKAIAELGIKSPLRNAMLTKSDIRALSKELGLPTWDKSSFACLASRIPYGDKITAENLAMIEKAEAFLKNEGFKQYRVRLHGTLARIELLPEDMDRFMEPALREKANKELRGLGFSYVTMDIMGYRTGSLNEIL